MQQISTLLTVPAASIPEMVLAVVGVAATSYVLGSLCFAIIFTKLFTGKDIRKLGSGNAGTANVLRSAGFIPGALTGIFDFLKGVLAVYIGYWLFELVGFDRYTGGCFATLFVLIGHLYPVFFRYRGGKGVMTMAGIIVVLNWELSLIIITIYLIVILVTRITSVAALVAFAVLPIVNALLCGFSGQPWLKSSIFFVLISVLIFYTHRENIKRLKDGKEKKLVVKK